MQGTAARLIPILNADQFTTMARVLAAQSRRRQSSLSLLMLSLDDVAPAEADEADAELGAFLRRTVREGDLIGRFADLEYALLVTDTSQAGAMMLAQRIQAALRGLPGAELRQSRSMSVGIASWPDSAPTTDELLEQAASALEEAKAAGSSRVHLAGWDGPGGWISTELERDRVAARRRAARVRLTRAFERKWIKSARIRTEPDACAVCAGAARDEAAPNLTSQLPVIGCSSGRGCRCNYASPALTARPLQASIDVADADALRIPRNLRSAARFGTDPRQRCQPAEILAYFENFPLLHTRPRATLAADEVVYLVRSAEQAWERPGSLAAAMQGAEIPIELPLEPWLKRQAKPPNFPGRALQGTRRGTLLVTNRRIVFDDGASVNSLPLLQVTDLEWVGNGIACRAEGWRSRLVFLVSDALPVSLYLARALRADLLLC